MRRRYALYLGLICLMAVIVRVMAIVALGPNTMRFPDERVYFSIAESVSAGDGYQYKGKPTAYLAPVLPMVIAATISVCGDNPCAVKFLFALLSGLVVYLIASVGGFSRRGQLFSLLCSLHFTRCRFSFRQRFILNFLARSGWQGFLH